MARSTHPPRPARPRFVGLVSLVFWLVACRASDPSPASDEPSLRKQTAAHSSPEVACGDSGMAECPTQRWMKATLQAYLRTHDYRRLEASFNQLAAHAPTAYDRWQEMSRAGARAAARQQEDGVRKVCQDCHDAYRAPFRREMREAALF